MHTPNWLKEYLIFTRKDRIGAAVVVAVVGGSVFLPKFFSREFSGPIVKPDTSMTLARDTLQEREAEKRSAYRYRNETDNYRYEPSETKSFTAGELFRFDPNTATLNEWLRLGLNERTSKTILKYVSKGGKFYKPEDLMRIWSMPEGFYERVKGYINITSVTRNYSVYESKPFVREERKPVMVGINGAETSAFIALPGIGSKLSARIVNFREKLGGFHSVEQIGETWGLPDSTFQKIRSRLQVDGEVRKLNVNTATKDELKAHPYIRWNLANAIVEYRNQHGAFKSLEELKHIALVYEATFGKMAPYLSL